MPFTNEEKLEAITRELRFRRRVYADRVANNKMKPAFADYQTKIFEEIEADYKAKAQGERLL